MYRAVAITFFLFPSVCLGQTYSAEKIDLARQNVELFDEAEKCAGTVKFQEYGLAKSGPCPELMDRINAQRQREDEVGLVPLLCLSGYIYSAAVTAIRGDMSDFDYYRADFDRCRELVEGAT